MTTSEPFLPVPEDDALDAAASAVVDGIATPEEAALVAAAPDGAARVAALRRVAEAVGSPVPAQDPAAAGAGRAAALAAFDEGAADAADDGSSGKVGPGPATASGGGGAPVTRLPSAAGRPRRMRVLAAVAAALVLLVGIGALSVAVLSSDDDATTFTASGPAKDEARTSTAAESAAPPSTAPAAAASGAPGGTSGTSQSNLPAGGPTPGPVAPPSPAAAAAPPPVVDGGAVGRQDEVETLAQRAAAALDGTPDRAVAAPDAALPSDVQACATAGAANAGEAVGALRYRATGTFQGTSAVILAFDRPGRQPPRLLLVQARSGCTILASTHF